MNILCGIPIAFDRADEKHVLNSKPMRTLITIVGKLAGGIARRLVPAAEYPRMHEPKQHGPMETVEFNANRAFQVHAFEDEGASYFVELSDGRVLHLAGQYLDDLAEITDDPENNHPQLFPCARFRVTRRKDTGRVHELEPLSPPFTSDAEFPPFTAEDLKAGWRPADGAILTESYDALKERLAGRGVTVEDVEDPVIDE